MLPAVSKLLQLYFCGFRENAYAVGGIPMLHMRSQPDNMYFHCTEANYVKRLTKLKRFAFYAHAQTLIIAHLETAFDLT